MIRYGKVALCSALVWSGCMMEEPGERSLVDTSADDTVIEQGLVGGAQAMPGQWDSAIFWQSNGGACSGSVVGPRHILTAAHCVQVVDFDRGLLFSDISPALAPGSFIAISNDKEIARQSAFTSLSIDSVEVHPAWDQACELGCGYTNSMTAPFPPDLAVIKVREDIPTSFEQARVLTGALLPGIPVSIMGYGCESGLSAPHGPITRLKYFPTRTVNASYTQHAYTFVPRLQSTLFERHYVITPGQDTYGEASLCPGDSGGPLYLTDASDGEIVVGVNAYYTFKDPNGGIATTNAHTRLGRDNPSQTAAWLSDQLPLLSFKDQAPRVDILALELLENFVTTLGGTNDSDEVQGTRSDELLSGRRGDDVLRGGGGNDGLDGGPQGDWLYGEEGHDVLRGGAGADVLDGGPGEDVLMGEQGPDVYVMTPGGDHDLVFGDRDGQNHVICQGFDSPPYVYTQGEDWILWSADGTQSMRITDSTIVSFYGCARPPLKLEF